YLLLDARFQNPLTPLLRTNRSEVLMSEVSDIPAERLAAIYDIHLRPEVHQPLRGRASSQYVSSFERRQYARDSFESFRVVVAKLPGFVDAQHIESRE